MIHKEFQHLLAIREAAIEGARAHYRSSGLAEAAVPVLVGITGACENVSTLYRVAGSAPVHLTQTGQLALEHALCVSKGVYCITPSFRTDKIDERHLHEFTLIEEEISFDHPLIARSEDEYDSSLLFEALLGRITQSVKAVVRSCVEHAPDAVASLGGRIDDLGEMLSQDFYRLTYTESVDLLNSADDGHVPWGSDLGSVQERDLLELVAREHGGPLRPTFVTHYPEGIKFFNMKVDDTNEDVVQSADLLLPLAGEAVGSAVREHRYDRLLKRLTSSTMFEHIVEQRLATLEDFVPYLEVVESGASGPHAGYGIGLERVLQFLIGSTDIREASVAYKLSAMMGFTDALASAQSGSRAPGF
ncbi:amino acid--tRNA ligase-related protein [Glycomyces buryatensis]|uniref:Aminoacyl-transfer RNA synthetases class-II family profile domain-containing protein n=1 Tax=Glycomyces buryatensis TaxID=2570927 RepID=A0A4S8Q9K4_9ACTN|nr:amino acid--tRNA ligase-related protein [Glycomyces buryatensis]THV37619.1 hypothetical protein FAB82_20290 [Glycomyces buryatensis]